MVLSCYDVYRVVRLLRKCPSCDRFPSHSLSQKWLHYIQIWSYWRPSLATGMTNAFSVRVVLSKYNDASTGLLYTCSCNWLNVFLALYASISDVGIALLSPGFSLVIHKVAWNALIPIVRCLCSLFLCYISSSLSFFPWSWPSVISVQAGDSVMHSFLSLQAVLSSGMQLTGLGHLGPFQSYYIISSFSQTIAPLLKWRYRSPHLSGREL